jgi:hypothetical protein
MTTQSATSAEEAFDIQILKWRTTNANPSVKLGFLAGHASRDAEVAELKTKSTRLQEMLDDNDKEMQAYQQIGVENAELTRLLAVALEAMSDLLFPSKKINAAINELKQGAGK